MTFSNRSMPSLIPLKLQAYYHDLSPRHPNTHKNDYGHVLIIGGHPGFSGAVRLAGEAALRTGAGLVTVATHPTHAALIAMGIPELMCHSIDHPQTLQPLLDKASIIVIGPGLGQDHWSIGLLQTTLAIQDKPILFDADALRLITKISYHPLPHHLYTPHPGEAAHLLKTTTQHIQSDRLAALMQLTQFAPGIMVLKGSQTLIGQDKQNVYINQAGNPGMATAGMGDVLTGIIAGLIAQHISLLNAACLGVLIHAMAGDNRAKKGMRGLIASDLLPELPALLNPVC